MTTLLVDTTARLLWMDGERVPCAIGRSGACDAGAKKEGDGFTPLGRWPIRSALLRPDRGLRPPAHLPWRWLRPADGWSDEPTDPAYNRPIVHPHIVSAERLWREDALYDAILILGHNDTPPVPGAGSAIFLHMLGGGTTEGCVAIDCEAMARMLARIMPGDALEIR